MCVDFLFRNSGQLDHVSRLSIIIYLLEVFQISGTKPKRKEINPELKLQQLKFKKKITRGIQSKIWIGRRKKSANLKIGQ